jgi:hypothetical protein
MQPQRLQKVATALPIFEPNQLLKMKNTILIILRLRLVIVSLILISINSCSSDKSFTITGTVRDVETGKDGYTATLIDDNGEKFDAVFSIVKLGNEYRVFTAGERVRLTGDTLHLENKLRVIVNGINR